MLWYKSWIDTRWRFLIGLLILVVFACGTVMSFSTVRALAAALPPEAVAGTDSLQQELQESIEMVKTFKGYAWSQWFAQGLSGLPGLLTVFAALLGSGSPLAKSGSGSLFSLALPASRGRWIGTRAATGLAELLALALASSVTVALVAPFVGEQFAFMDAVVYGLCAFVVASVFFGVAVLASTVFNDVWRPLLLTCLAAMVIAGSGMVLPARHGLFEAMAGGAYFYDGSLPWAELLISAAATAGLVYAAGARLARRDF